MAEATTDNRRQLVNFSFFKVDPAWRRLPPAEREQGKHEFCQVVQDYTQQMAVLSYSLVGIRGDCDFLLWRIGYALEPFQEMTAKLLATGLGRWLTIPYSFLSMTKHSIYLVGHKHDGQLDARGRIEPGVHKYLFIYPFVKTREWYKMTEAARQGMMKEHIQIGHKYPRVKLNTTYSFGLDDQEFVVAFESDYPEDFVDLVMDLRESEASRFTLRDTPIFTCVHRPIDEVLGLLGG
ncbi:MAG TPA: chlorite dismutase family protein [Candidatus Xenobia bacterium]|nr:chlorite dismutase family protein [Candidatus Xenobia bacterium]